MWTGGEFRCRELFSEPNVALVVDQQSQVVIPCNQLRRISRRLAQLPKRPVKRPDHAPKEVNSVDEQFFRRTPPAPSSTASSRDIGYQPRIGLPTRGRRRATVAATRWTRHHGTHNVVEGVDRGIDSGGAGVGNAAVPLPLATTGAPRRPAYLPKEIGCGGTALGKYGRTWAPRSHGNAPHDQGGSVRSRLVHNIT